MKNLKDIEGEMNSRPSLNAYAELEQLLEGLSISKYSKDKILDKWQSGAADVIKEDPYILALDITGIAFPTADKLAKRLGTNMKSPIRIDAAIIHVLREAAFMRGHTYMPIQYCLTECRKLLGLEYSWIETGLTGLEQKGVLRLNEKDVQYEQYAKAEEKIARRIRELAEHPTAPGLPDFEDLEADQREALEEATKNSVFILTGAPGTGKTYTIQRIIGSYRGLKIELAAPTGKAAKRMYEQTLKPAQTIHRLLEPYRVGDGFRFARDGFNQLEVDLIVIDEMSMVDVTLMASLLDAIKPGTRLILIGDTYQLPSVGAGNVLKDLIESGTVPCAELKTIKRIDEAGLVVKNCHAIKNGQSITTGTKDDDFFFIRQDTEDGVRETILDLVQNRLPKAYPDLDPLSDIQVITALRTRSKLSCKGLNAEFQQRLNANPFLPRSKRFKIGDKVIQTKNDYGHGILNGDIGIVSFIDTDSRKIGIDFDSPERTVELSLYQNQLDLAYAITVHKFQGSEAPIIIIPIHRCLGGMVPQRNWLYTGVSRAQQICILVGQPEEADKIIGRNQQQRRFTKLARILRGE